ncbi:MAG: sulfotransferase domain-containing protein [Candidatus Marinimicrobia bacterium]|nr:sulfotransferase domain-containing protein [Candidatus Neomarinimicrobiota bacterium]
MNRRLFLHIGYPKTGTTTLQQYLFPYHSDLIDISSAVKSLNFIKELHHCREQTFLRNLLINKQRFTEQLDIQAGIHILSEESLLSYSMFFQNDPSPQVYTSDPASTARKLQYLFLKSGLFDEVKIVITIRRQADLLKSMYAQLYNNTFKHYPQTKNFSKYVNYVLDKDPDGFMLDTLYFQDITELYIDQFGEGHVKVLVFEQLRTDPNRFIQTLAEFLGIDVTQAIDLLENKKTNAKSSSQGYRSDTRSLMDQLTIYKQRFLGDRSWNISNWSVIDRLRAVEVPGKILHDISLSARDENRLADLFQSSNRSLSEKHQLNLKEYGYF